MTILQKLFGIGAKDDTADIKENWWTLDRIFMAFYLNAQKIDEVFIQRYGDLVEFGKANAKNLAFTLGMKLRAPEVLQFLDALRAEALAKGNWNSTKDESFKYRVPTLTRFMIMKSYWDKGGHLTSVSHYDGKQALQQAQLVIYQGPYSYSEDVHNISTDRVLTDGQKDAIVEAQRNKRCNPDDYRGVLALLSDSLMVATLFKDYITDRGDRFMGFDVEGPSSLTFIGNVIGRKADILFLDPVGCGVYTPPAEDPNTT